MAMVYYAHMFKQFIHKTKKKVLGKYLVSLKETKLKTKMTKIIKQFQTYDNMQPLADDMKSYR